MILLSCDSAQFSSVFLSCSKNSSRLEKKNSVVFLFAGNSIQKIHHQKANVGEHTSLKGNRAKQNWKGESRQESGNSSLRPLAVIL